MMSLGPQALAPATSRSRSHTPAPAATSTPSLPQFLTRFLKITIELEQHFLRDRIRLTSLLDAKYGSAYLQIRQALIIEEVFTQAQHIIPHLALHDVAAWAGI